MGIVTVFKCYANLLGMSLQKEMKQPADIILVNHKESERISKTGSVTWAEHSWGYVPSWCGDVWARCSVSGCEVVPGAKPKGEICRVISSLGVSFPPQLRECSPGARKGDAWRETALLGSTKCVFGAIFYYSS